MQNIVTQVSPESVNGVNPLLNTEESGYYDDNNNNDYDNSLIHLNIQESHYVITRDQLMSLPESLLLCLFPSGVFLDRSGHVITNLTPEDEVYISDFSPGCFEYIMDVYMKGYDDLVNYPVESLYNNDPNEKQSFGFDSNSTSEDDILHQKPVIIVLREDLDYYCVPQQRFEFEVQSDVANNDDLLDHLMSQVKVAAGNYLSSKTSIFQGLYSSNRLKKKVNGEHTLGAAEQHLMEMLCSSGFDMKTKWGNRTQENGKTVISSLMLCRIDNETTEQFRVEYYDTLKKWENDMKKQHEHNPVKPKVYDLVHRPDINNKLLLFWRKPARKCWWGEEDVELEVQIYGNYKMKDDDHKVILLKTPTTNDGSQLMKIRIPVRLHIRRVWTLELSVIGMQ